MEPFPPRIDDDWCQGEVHYVAGVVEENFWQLLGFMAGLIV